MPPKAKTSSGQQQEGTSRPTSAGQGSNNNSTGISKLVENPLYSFSTDVSQEFAKQIEELTKNMAKHMDRTLAMTAMGGDIEKPFSATRDGEIVHVVYPVHVKEGDLLGGLITILAAQLPTCVIHQGTAGWSEPEWTGESRAHLAGLISGLHRLPESFSHTSSPMDLSRISMWITACSSALSVPGGVRDAHGEVLPSSVGGGKSASKYMTKIISGLRSNVTDESATKAIDTLSILLKLWQRNQSAHALGIVRKCKIAWSTVLNRAAPTMTIKGKKGKPDQTVVKSPPKPSRSPWLSKAERAELGQIFKDDWSHLDNIRKSWVNLIPLEQHKQFDSYISQIKKHFETLNNISNSVHAKLGKRKHWIERICKADDFKPKTKKDESPSFALSDHFFSKNLTTTSMEVKKLFSPLTYLPDKYDPLKIWNACIPDKSGERARITSANFNENEDGPTYKLWRIWADMFLPVFTTESVKLAEPQTIADNNLFSRLFGLTKEN